MPRDNEQTLRGAFEAFGRGDLRAAKACFHPEAEIRNRVGGLQGEVYRGGNLVEDWLAGITDVWADYRLELEDLIGEGDAFVATTRNRGRASGSGIPLDDRQYAALRFKDGLIWRVQSCSTMEEAVKEAGLAGQRDNSEVLREVADAVRRGDLGAAQSRFHPEAELRNQTGALHGTVYRGETLVQDWLGDLREVWGDLRLEVEAITGEGDGFVATTRNHARAVGSRIALDARQYVGVRFKDGLIWRVHVCPTMAEALEAAGLPG